MQSCFKQFHKFARETTKTITFTYLVTRAFKIVFQISMLNMMAHSSRPFLPNPAPFVFAYTPWDIRDHLLHYRSYARRRPSSNLLTSYTYPCLSSDRTQRIGLAPLPPPRTAALGRNCKPLTSFCIRDILGQDNEKEESKSWRKRPDGISSQYNKNAVEGECKSSSRETTRMDGPLSNGCVHTETLEQSPCSSHLTLSKCSCNTTTSSASIAQSRVSSPCCHHIEIVSDDGGDVFNDSSVCGDDDEQEDEEINVEDDDETTPGQQKSRRAIDGVSPLDALVAMTSKAFERVERPDSAETRQRDLAILYSKHTPPKKRRKSRTAFSNQQIYELEKRFLFQKYLTPTDRDDIANTLGLTNAQVITWFQNRRAKLKRDMEELKNDMTAAKKLSAEHRTHAATVVGVQQRRVPREAVKKATEERNAGDGFVGSVSSSSVPPSSPSSSSSPSTSPVTIHSSSSSPSSSVPSSRSLSHSEGGCCQRSSRSAASTDTVIISHSDCSDADSGTGSDINIENNDNNVNNNSSNTARDSNGSRIKFSVSDRKQGP